MGEIDERAIEGKSRLVLLRWAILLEKQRIKDAEFLIERATTVLSRPSVEGHFDSYEIDLDEVIGRCEEALADSYGTSVSDALDQVANAHFDRWGG